WPDGFVCGCCGVIGEPWIMARGVFRCKACHGNTSLTAGTVFQDTRKPLRTWFLAMWFTTSQKNGVSALGLQRVLGLGSYETAWTWMHKLRRAMVRPGRDRLTGEIEIDETYVGGPEEGKRGREIEKKSVVVVAAEKKRPWNRAHPPAARQGCLRRKPAGLHSRDSGSGRHNPYRWLERLSLGGVKG